MNRGSPISEGCRTPYTVVDRQSREVAPPQGNLEERFALLARRLQAVEEQRAQDLVCREEDGQNSRQLAEKVEYLEKRGEEDRKELDALKEVVAHLKGELQQSESENRTLMQKLLETFEKLLEKLLEKQSAAEKSFLKKAVGLAILGVITGGLPGLGAGYALGIFGSSIEDYGEEIQKTRTEIAELKGRLFAIDSTRRSPQV